MLAQVSTLFLSALVLKAWVTGDGSSARKISNSWLAWRPARAWQQRLRLAFVWILRAAPAVPDRRVASAGGGSWGAAPARRSPAVAQICGPPADSGRRVGTAAADSGEQLPEHFSYIYKWQAHMMHTYTYTQYKHTHTNNHTKHTPSMKIRCSKKTVRSGARQKF